MGLGKLSVVLPQLNEVKLLSYNLNILPLLGSLFGTGQGMHAPERLESFIEHPSLIKHDILTLQEVFATPLLPGCRQRYFLRRMFKKGYTNVVKIRQISLTRIIFNRKWTDSGLLILSRLPIVASDSLIFTSTGIGIDSGGSLFRGCYYLDTRMLPSLAFSSMALYLLVYGFVLCRLMYHRSNERDYIREDTDR